ncbi:calcium/proton exchanger [Mycena crocata]|nr:calcium/proton exchanger [Mycena crocata]
MPPPVLPARSSSVEVTVSPTTLTSRSEAKIQRAPTRGRALEANEESTKLGPFPSNPVLRGLARFRRSIARRFFKKTGPEPVWTDSLWAILLSWCIPLRNNYFIPLNLLLAFIPVSWVLHWTLPTQYTLIFITGFIAIIPLAKLLAFATDDLSLRMGQALAGFTNATLGNVVELIVAIIALKECELGIVQSSLIGSILSNLLLVLGMCCFVGGINYSEQGFASGASQLNSSLLMLTAVTVVLPGIYDMTQKAVNPDIVQAQILKFSHGLAFIMLVIYAGLLWFQLFSHNAMYQDDSPDIAKSTAYNRNRDIKSSGTTLIELGNMPHVDEPRSIDGAEGAPTEPAPEEEELETPKMNKWVCALLLAAVTVLVAFTAEFLVGSINGLTASGAITKEFVGIILLPIVGNAAEHASAVSGASKDKMTLAMNVAVGSSIQIGLFVIPLTVIVGWGLGTPMTLLFDPYEAICLVLAVFVVNYVCQDGKSNWLEGMILMCLYVGFATTLFFYPGMSPVEHFASCS